MPSHHRLTSLALPALRTHPLSRETAQQVRVVRKEAPICRFCTLIKAQRRHFPSAPGSGNPCFSTSLQRRSQEKQSQASPHSQTGRTDDSRSRTEARRSSRPRIPKAALVAALLAASGLYLLVWPDPPLTRILDEERFTPFDLVAREAASPTSFVLTLRPSPGASPSLSEHDAAAQLGEPWRMFDLWAVEVKQPQLQIAREYTPLPPRACDGEGTIRLLIRAVDGGEVSTYLSKLAVGSRVEVRGPKGGFDLTNRLGMGNPGEVVFLAGGTGIATAMQAAHSVLGDAGDTVRETTPGPGAGPSESRMKVFWAVRSRKEIQSEVSSNHPGNSRSLWDFLTRKPTRQPRGELVPELENPTCVSEQLQEMQAQYGQRLSVEFAVDDEGTLVSSSDVARALESDSIPRNVSTKPATITTTRTTAESAKPCLFHSQAMHRVMTDGAPNCGRKDLFKQQDCTCILGDGSVQGDVQGKNLLLVSGPDGFIAAYAGAKPWHGGGQIQGAMGGMLARLEGKRPGLLGEWLVLKL